MNLRHSHSCLIVTLQPCDFYNSEDWILNLTVSGKQIPSIVYIEINGNSFKLKKDTENKFNYVLKGVDQDVEFFLLGGGYKIGPYLLKALAMPKVVDLSLNLDYPEYTGLKDETIRNNGDISIPEGTIINLSVGMKHSDYLTLIFKKDTIVKKVKERFNYKKQIIENTPYQIITTNSHNLSDTLSYYISVIKDEYPEITIAQNYDSINAQFLFTGEIKDDYLILQNIGRRKNATFYFC